MFFQKLVTNINDFTNLLSPKNLSKYSYFNPQKICKIVHYIHLLYRGTSFNFLGFFSVHSVKNTLVCLSITCHSVTFFTLNCFLQLFQKVVKLQNIKKRKDIGQEFDMKTNFIIYYLFILLASKNGQFCHSVT